ncbi:MAG: type III-B CRISPR module RAMP protein Cmr4 [Spirochaetales bacterium]|nr:type III-B CRISPR module RAMP protein Cmr4 [Spirochaetales bacterium]
MSDAEYKPTTYFVMSLDPIHIGTGGYRLGRVDNTIVREAGTNLPKIPGTSIEGSARTYVYYAEQENKEINEACAVGKELNKVEPCGICPVCVTFGFTTKKKSLHGMAQFSDARILFFPVHSMIGPVWVTTPKLLSDIGIDKFSVADEHIRTNLVDKGKKLNLGWLYLENEEKFDLSSSLNEIPTDIKNKAVLISEKLFSRVVNSNLEVRTSVSIDPRTGTAEDGALFTYEAIPRATILWFDLVANDPGKFDVDSSIKSKEDVINEVEKSFNYFNTLGIGGMQTKGFGRLKRLSEDSK